MDDWITYLEAEPKSEPFLSIAAAWKADKARLAEVHKTLAPLVDDDNRPVEALARYAVARIAEAERLLRKCRGLIEAMDDYLEQLVPRTDSLVGSHPALADIDAFLGATDSAS